MGVPWPPVQRRNYDETSHHAGCKVLLYNASRQLNIFRLASLE